MYFILKYTSLHAKIHAYMQHVSHLAIGNITILRISCDILATILGHSGNNLDAQALGCEFILAEQMPQRKVLHRDFCVCNRVQ